VSSFKNGRTTKRAALVALSLAAVSAVVLTAASGAGASRKASPIAGQRFTLMIQSSPTASKVLQAHAIQILKNQGVDASIKWNATSSNIAIAQLQSGDVDGFSNAVAGGLGAAIAGIPLVDFALVNPREDYVFMTRPDITSLSQLKGKKIGVLDTTSINYPQALIVLKKAGFDASDVSIVVTGGQSTRLAALVAGRLDGTMLSHAAAIQLVPQGYHVLYDFTKQSSSMYDDNIFAMRSWLASHKALAIAFNKAILQTYVWFNNPKNEDAVVKEAVALAPGTDEAQTKQLFDTLRTLNWAVEKATLNIPTLKYEAALFRQVGAVTGTIPIGQWANVAYANAAKAQLYPVKKAVVKKKK
jgi:ABC-type nitrate/sulfonate/bicarbonate transport system substrate-binding protein